MAFRGWPKVRVRTDEGRDVEAVAPLIVSASRRTDIPAFYARWFLKRLDAGYVGWVNPFSGQAQYVSLAKARVVVFWTKNPRPLLPHLRALDERGINYYFHVTLNDYEAEGLEPGVPPLGARLEAFRALSEAIGTARVTWRYDPLFLADGLPLERLIERVARVGDALHPFTEKLVIAFGDIAQYRKVERRLAARPGRCRELAAEEMRSFAQRLVEAMRPWGLEIATCAEAIDLADVGIGHNRCVDDRLLARLFPDDAELMRFLAAGYPGLKDKGQRKACGCIVSKDIGAYDTCPALCDYCYAVSSSQVVRTAVQAHRPESASLI